MTMQPVSCPTLMAHDDNRSANTEVEGVPNPPSNLLYVQIRPGPQVLVCAGIGELCNEVP